MAKYLKVDYRFFRISGVTTNSALILSYVVSLCDSKKKSFFASNEHIAHVLGCSTKTASTCISKLKSQGLIKTWNHKHKRYIQYIKANLAVALEKVDEIDAEKKALALQKMRELEEGASTTIEEKQVEDIVPEASQASVSNLPSKTSLRRNLSSSDFNSTIIERVDHYFSEASHFQIECSLEEVLPVVGGTATEFLELLNYLEESGCLNFDINGNLIKITLGTEIYPRI